MSTSERVPRERYHHGYLPNALVEAARELVAEAGPERFSLREAARAVGVSPNAAYRHFANKSELLNAVALDAFAALGREMERAEARAARAVREDPAVARFKATGRAYVHFALAQPELFRLMFGEHGMRALKNASAVPSPSAYDRLGAALDGLVEAGHLSPRARAGAELKAWTIVHGFATLVLEGAQRFESPDAQAGALESVLDLAVAGLSARP
jgi:AcrR family transcriptional regulator